MSHNYYSSRKRKRPLSKKQKAQNKRQREVNRIYKVWLHTRHLYSYKQLEEPPYSASQAKSMGFDVYWGICKFGHVGERSVKGHNCLACRSITRSLRDAKKRGAIKLKLTREEKTRIADLYREAQLLKETTGIDHHVDHIRPISAGGLHHPDNLQVITAEENLKKGSFYKGRRRRYSREERRLQRAIFKEKQIQKLSTSKPKFHNISDNWFWWVFVVLMLVYFFN
jgi:5-methylcytosine-specific restriction endonuclease McrA